MPSSFASVLENFTLLLSNCCAIIISLHARQTEHDPWSHSRWVLDCMQADKQTTAYQFTYLFTIADLRPNETHNCTANLSFHHFSQFHHGLGHPWIMAVSSLLRFCSPSSQDCRSGHSRHVWTLLVTLTAVIFLANVARADCYWPDGTENDEHQPCYVPHGGAIGLCCGTGDVCLSNGVCMSDMEVDASEGYIYYRGSCTFKDWSKGKNCPTMCIKGSGISPHTDVGVIPCPGSDTGWYCADSNVHKANCSTGAFIVSLSSTCFFAPVCTSYPE